VLPFTLPTGDQPTLFVRAEDWTGVTENGNTVPDWWFWEYFGTTALSDTNLDCAANMLLDDYTNGINPNPLTASLISVETCQNTPVSFTLSGYDQCGDNPATFTYTLLTAPVHGYLINAPGTDTDPTYLYTPTNSNFTGIDSFTYKISHNCDANSATGAVSILVGDTTLCPTPQTAMTETNKSVGLILSAYSSFGCTSVVDYSIVNSPAYGTLSGTPPNLTYTPDHNFEGTDSFTFTASNGVWSSVCSDAVVTLYIVAGPTNLTAQCLANGVGVLLSWSLDDKVQEMQAVDGLGIAGFQIYRRISPGLFTTNDIIFTTYDTSQTIYSDLGAASGTTYYYAVTFIYQDPDTGSLHASPFSREVPITTCCPANSGNELWVNYGHSPQQLAKWIMGTNPVTIANATCTGTNLAIGIFGNGSAVGLPAGTGAPGLPIDTGVILASGAICNAIGPNNSSSATTQFGIAGDPDLDSLVGNGATYDAAVLEFDIVSTNSFTLTFQYIFASEEYPEWINHFNDPMAIFVSTNRVGTNWICSINNDLALVPGTTNLPVSVNSINGGWLKGNVFPTNPQYSIDNCDPGYKAATNAAVAPVFNIQYDGLTTNLTAHIYIHAGVTNHVKIAIADYGDYQYDSAVFIKAQLSCP